MFSFGFLSWLTRTSSRYKEQPRKILPAGGAAGTCRVNPDTTGEWSLVATSSMHLYEEWRMVEGGGGRGRREGGREGGGGGR